MTKLLIGGNFKRPLIILSIFFLSTFNLQPHKKKRKNFNPKNQTNFKLTYFFLFIKISVTMNINSASTIDNYETVVN